MNYFSALTQKLNFTAPKNEGPWPRRFAVLCVCLIVFFHFFKSPLALAFDPHEENCLPELHLALLVLRTPSTVAEGDYVVFRPSGPTANIKREFLLKRVAGVGGDRLTIHDKKIWINDHLVATGLDLLDLTRANPVDFERDETIPAGQLFVIGTHPKSFDSRYWGYLNQSQIEGLAYKVL